MCCSPHTIGAMTMGLGVKTDLGSGSVVAHLVHGNEIQESWSRGSSVGISYKF